MGLRGPKPLPTKILEARGSWRAKAKDRQGEPEVPAIEVGPRMPKWLKRAGRAEWRRVVPLMMQAKYLTELDGTNLGLMCKALDDYWEADGAVKEHGLLIKGATGNLVMNPAVHERQRAWQRYTRLAASFGLTPADRARVHTADGDPMPAPTGVTTENKPAGGGLKYFA